MVKRYLLFIILFLLNPIQLQQFVLPRISFFFLYNSSQSRFLFIPQLLQRWSGYFFSFRLFTSPIVLVISYLLPQQQTILSYLGSHSFPSRLTILLVLQQQETIFPINSLRNLAIQSIQTSHFLLLDMDLWPTSIHYSLYSTYSEFI